ncbi:MAG: transposase [Patescibacteria group bacterium]|nr:transposase [Patescibacteria group bacterium]
MPAKNSLKQYAEESCYHLYNRGVEKRDIFLDKQDYSVFCSYLKTYLLPKDEIGLYSLISSQDAKIEEKDKAIKLLSLNNFSNEINLLAFSLLPNHFHLLVKQTSANGIDKFMNSLLTRYVMYFNRKYQRIGPLFQGVYKAVLVNSDEQLLCLSQYIHNNPIEFLGVTFKDWKNVIWPFSLPEYLGERKTEWVKTQTILDYFNKTNPNQSYGNFMRNEEKSALIEPIAIDI